MYGAVQGVAAQVTALHAALQTVQRDVADLRAIERRRAAEPVPAPAPAAPPIVAPVPPPPVVEPAVAIDEAALRQKLLESMHVLIGDAVQRAEARVRDEARRERADAARGLDAALAEVEARCRASTAEVEARLGAELAAVAETASAARVAASSACVNGVACSVSALAAAPSVLDAQTLDALAVSALPAGAGDDIQFTMAGGGPASSVAPAMAAAAAPPVAAGGGVVANGGGSATRGRGGGARSRARGGG